MKHLKTIFACMLMAVLSIGQVWAVDYELVYTLDGTVTSGGNSNYAQDGGGLTQSSIDWSVTGNTTINPWRIGGKNLSGVDRLAYSKTAISDNIAKIEIEHGTATLTVNSIKVEVASDAAFNNIISTFNESYSSNVTITVLRPDGKDWTGRFYRITYNVTAGSSNSYVQLKSVKFYKEKSAGAPVLESITISGDLTDKSYEVGESIDFSGLTATGYYSDESSDDLTDEVEWSFSPALTAGLTSVTVTATLNEISGNKIINGLTVTEHVVTPGAYDIPTDNDLWGTSYSGQASGITTLTGSKNDVSITINKNTGSNMYVTSSQTRIYSGYTMVFSVPNGYAITALQFTADGSNWQGDHTADVGTMTDNKNWSGEANSVTITVAGTCRMKAVKVTYAVSAPSKQDAGLAYATADAQNLVKVGASFTAPTLTNPNSLTPSYASSDANVVAVNASTGELTIKAAGKAVITASSVENETYKAGSASYTIFVAEQAGTADDPLTEASAKALIDLGCTLTAHVNGIIATATYNATYFNYAVTLTNGVQFYRLKDLNNADFSSGYLGAGDEVTAVGALKKHNSTYELDEGCYLTFYEQATAQLTPIANTKETAYTVAQALAFAAAPTTYDLADYVYVQGVVYDVKSFSNGAMNIFIKDADTENQFELYKCAGINDGSATTPFEALTDVQEGDVVIGYGQLTVFNNVYEFKQGNYLVDLDRPAVAVSSVELASTATVKVGNTINLSASVLPANATDKVIEWSIQSGNDNITLNNGTVTGVAEGTAVVRATSHADNTKYAECTITIAAADPVYAYYNYEKVTATADIEDGEYLIVYEGDETHDAAVFDGSLDTDNLDKEKKVITVEIADNMIVGTTALHAATFTIDVTAGTIQSASGLYIGKDAYANGLDKSSETAYTNTIAISEGIAVITSEGNCTLRYNYASDQLRFRYYKSGQQAIQLYKKVGTNEAPKANPQLAWDPADDIEITVGETFTAPTLTYAQGFNGVDDIVIESNNTNLATVNAGVVSLVANATGEATITATFAGNDDYKPATVSYNITVSAAVVPPTPAVSGNVVIIAEYDNKFYAMTNSLANGALAGVEVEKDGSNIVVASAEDKAAIQWTATVTDEYTTLKDANDKYIKGSNGASLSLDDNAYNWNWDSDNSCYISSAYTTRGLFFSNSGNVFKGYALENIVKTGYAATEVIEIDPENIVITSKVDPGIAYDPATLTITQGDTWTAPTLVNPNSVTITSYASNNVAVATVTNEGVIALAGGTGTATITAHFDGDASYLEADATYEITVNAPAPTPTSTTYTKVTATGDITDGDYLIVYETTSVAFDGSLETLDAEGNSVAVTINDGVIAGTTAIDAATFTIDVTAGTLQSASGYYIGVGSNSNGLKQTDVAEIYTHTFSIDGGNAVIASNFEGSTMKLRYNSNTSAGNLRFRYYKNDGQQAIQLYKKDVPAPTTYTVTYGLNGGTGTTPTHDAVEATTVITLAGTTGITAPENQEFDGWLCDIDNEKYNAGDEYTMTAANTTFTAQWKDATPVEPEPVYTTVRDELTAGYYYTMCLNKAITHVKGASIWRVLSKEQNGLDIILEEVKGTLEAGRPYFFFATAAILEVVYTGDAVPAPVNDAENHGLVGSFTKEEIGISDYHYILYNNQLYFVNTLAYVGANRAYLDMTGVPAYGTVSQAPDRRRVTMQTNGEQVATGIDDVNVTSETAVKKLIDGQLFILRGEKMYDATGRLVK